MSQNNTLLLVAALLLLGGGGVLVYNKVGGLRRNNPGNIRYDGTAWEGLANPPSENGFNVFVDPVYGIRALARNLNNYVVIDGVAPTVNAIISRWAPPSENDTAAYIDAVRRDLGVDPNATLDLSSAMPGLVAAIISHENGLNPYSDAQILQGIALA